MSTLINLLMLYLTDANQRRLLAQIQFLQVQLKIARANAPKRLKITPSQKSRLLKLGQAVGPALKDTLSLVSIRTFNRWLKARPRKSKKAKLGRPRIIEDIRELVVRLAKENIWGSTRVFGELKKLTVRVCHTSVRNILKENGIDPGPQRGEGTWHEFLTMHAKTLWACDFITKRIWTTRGLVDCFILFFIHPGSRRVFICPATAHPTGKWMIQQAKNLLMHAEQLGLQVTHLIRDRDIKFGEGFDEVLKSEGAKVIRLPICSPNLNAYAERFAQTIQVECLDHFVVFGETHLDYLIREFTDYYNIDRPHQGIGNVPLGGASTNPPTEGRVLCKQRLGGLLKHYYRQAA